jgi:hypothetical protein
MVAVVGEGGAPWEGPTGPKFNAAPNWINGIKEY